MYLKYYGCVTCSLSQGSSNPHHFPVGTLSSANSANSFTNLNHSYANFKRPLRTVSNIVLITTFIRLPVSDAQNMGVSGNGSTGVGANASQEDHEEQSQKLREFVLSCLELGAVQAQVRNQTCVV